MSRLLNVDGIDAGYGRSRVLFGASLHVDEGESIALVGRNGMGKTTTIRTILGLCPASAGRVTFAGTDVTNAPPYRIARHGIGLVPEGREVFPTLTVRENLIATAANHGRLANPWTLAEIFGLFPRLADRAGALGSQLSGGEQQMLAIGRILRTGARLLLLDEPTEGLAPVIIQQIGRTIRTLKEQGFTILLVEQNFRFASTVADRYYVMEHGRIVEGFANAELDANLEKLHDYLGV